jgi:hypothetical protein
MATTLLAHEFEKPEAFEILRSINFTFIESPFCKLTKGLHDERHATTDAQRTSAAEMIRDGRDEINKWLSGTDVDSSGKDYTVFPVTTVQEARRGAADGVQRENTAHTWQMVRKLYGLIEPNMEAKPPKELALHYLVSLSTFCFV